MEQLVEEYKKGKVILFVGAGVSANLGIPTWAQLIDKISSELDYDADVFKTYGDYLTLAEYYKIEKGNLGLLRSWMDRAWHSEKIDIKTSIIHELIVKANFPIIYTTNYDNWIERAYDQFGVKYNKIVNVNDIADSKPNRNEIIKFHGDFSDDSSIVLGETSYFERLEFETPLDIKLRSDVLGKSVLFIGYSLSDINIRQLFYKLSKIWKNHGNGFEKPRSYIFSSKDNPVQEIVLKKWGIETITSGIENPGDALEKFLEKITNS